jgi:hypothetical protein
LFLNAAEETVLKTGNSFSMNPVSNLILAHNWEKLKNWAPVSIEFGKSLPTVSWRDLNKLEFVEPFFLQTVRRIREIDPEGEVTTGIETLLQIDKHIDCVEPTGFIFHVSRCGSTLISNAMRALKNSIVISEAFPIAATSWLFLDSNASNPGHQLFRSALLRSVVRLYGQRVKGSESRYFIKFSSLETTQLEHIRRIWPNVPWLFIIRNPEEVIVSNMRKDATWFPNDQNVEAAAMRLGCETEELGSMSREEYCARMIGHKCRIAVANADEHSWFIDYTELNEQTLERIARFFGATPAPSEVAAIRNVAGVYSKEQTRRPFVPDSEEKRQAASPLIRELSEKWAMESYSAALAIARNQYREKGRC